MSSAHLKNRPGSTSLMLRLMLRHDEVFRLPAGSRGVQVISGTAWLTVNGEDVLLKSGERVWLLVAKDLALVSALGRVPLILEVWGCNASSSPGMFSASPQNQPGMI